MSRSEEDSKFIEEDAKWLPLDAAILAVRRCLHEMIAALAAATAYLRSESEDEPDVPMSHRFSVVHTHECRAFEELCARIKGYDPGTIPESKVEDVMRLGRILATLTDSVLPDDDTSSNDLRGAIRALFSAACETSVKLPKTSFEGEVDSAQKLICEAFKSLSDGFHTVERKRKNGGKSESLKVDLTDNAKKFIQGVGDGVSGKVEESAGKVSNRLDNQAGCMKDLTHQVELSRKGQVVTVTSFKPKNQEKAFNYWVEARAKFGAKHISTEGFEYFTQELKDIGITDATTWSTVKEQWRCKTGASINKAVKAFNKATKTTVRK